MGDLVEMAAGSPALATDLLTPALRQSLNVATEADLTDEQYQLVQQFALAPCPPADKPTNDEFDKIIVAMAVVLKKPNVSHDQGRLKIGVYRKVLGNLSLTALTSAANTALQTLEWMPTPAELLRLSEGHRGEAQRLHARASVLRRNRGQRIHEETILALRVQRLSHDDLQNLPERTAQIAETQGLILTMSDGTRHYRTAETIRAQREERERGFAEEMSASRAHAHAGETDHDGGAENG